MLYTISRGNVQGYEEGQNPVVHLGATAEDIAGAGLPLKSVKIKVLTKTTTREFLSGNDSG